MGSRQQSEGLKRLQKEHKWKMTEKRVYHNKRYYKLNNDQLFPCLAMPTQGGTK